MNTELQSIPFKRADGSETSLAEYAGKVVLVVNVASKCGLTPQYDGLQALYARYKDRGFVIAGFPANEFAGQEPGTDAEIQQFCRLNYGVDFPVHAKIVVKGPGKHPLYGHLTQFRSEATKPGGLKGAIAAAKGLVRERMGGGSEGEITWNFEKFLIDRQGEVVARFAPDVKPEDPALVKAIEAELVREAVQA
jgi:glutathione peroxidase